MKGVFPVVLLELHRAGPQVEAPLGDAIGEAADKAAEEGVFALMGRIFLKRRSTATAQAAAAQAATALAAQVAAATTSTTSAAQVVATTTAPLTPAPATFAARTISTSCSNNSIRTQPCIRPCRRTPGRCRPPPPHRDRGRSRSGWRRRTSKPKI